MSGKPQERLVSKGLNRKQLYHKIHDHMAEECLGVLPKIYYGGVPLRLLTCSRGKKDEFAICHDQSQSEQRVEWNFITILYRD